MSIELFLKSLGLEQYVAVFEENDLCWDDLQELTAEELKDDLGITSLGHRKKIMKALASNDVRGAADPEDARIVETYPYILAMPYHLMLQEPAPFQKLQLMKDLFLNYLKYLGLLVATEYFSSGIRSNTINALFREKLFQPHFGHWNHFIREALAVLEEEGHAFFIPELPVHYKGVQQGRKAASYTVESRYTDEEGEIQTVKKKMTAIDGLIHFRNRHIGHGVTLSAVEGTAVFETYFPMIKQLLTELSFAVRYPLFRYRDGSVDKLMGLSPLREGSMENPPGSSETVWIALPDGKQLPMLPFIVPPEQYMAGFSKEVQLFVYEQNTSRRILYFSPELSNGEAAGEPVEMLKRLLRDKESGHPIEPDQVTRDYLLKITHEWNALTLKELEQEKKVIPGVYQAREESEGELIDFFDSASDIYFIAAEAGSGKTNLLAEACRFCGKAERAVLLLRGIRLDSADLAAEIAKRLNLASSQKLADIAAWNGDGCSLVLLIDGLNEHQSPVDAFADLGRLFELVPTGMLKAVVSWRINSPKDYPASWPGLEDRIFRAGGGERRDSSKDVLQRYAGSLKPFNRMELEAAWVSYSTSSRKLYKPRFSLSDLEEKDRGFAASLTNPLLLRLFLELYHGKGLSKKIKEIQIWPLWYRRMAERIPDSDAFLMPLIEQMYVMENPELELDALYDHPALKHTVRKLDIDSPYRRLLSGGILSQYFKDDILMISFTIEATWHYLLSRHLRRQGGGDLSDYLLTAVEGRAGLRGIREAAGTCLTDAAVGGDLSLLAAFIGNEPAHPDITARALAKALSFGEERDVVEKLAEKGAGNLAEALIAADYILERNLETTVRYEAFKAMAAIMNHHAVTPEQKARVLLYYCRVTHERGRYEEALCIAEQLAALGAAEGFPDTLFQALSGNRLAVAYRKLMRHVDDSTAAVYGDKALTHAHAARKIMEEELPADDPELARVYDTVEKVYEYRKEWPLAVEYGRRTIAVLEAAYGPQHSALAPAYNNTAIVLREDGKKDESIEFSRKAMDIVGKTLDPFHIEMAYAHWTLAYTFDKFGEPANGAEEMERVLEILRRVLPADHPNIAGAVKGLEEFKAKASGAE